LASKVVGLPRALNSLAGALLALVGGHSQIRYADAQLMRGAYAVHKDS